MKKEVNRIEELQRKVHLKSEKLQITGIVDAVIIKKVNNEVTSVIPIEVKTGSTNTKRPEKQHVMQLVAYILMAQEKWGKEKVKHGYIIYKDSKEKYRIEISEELERELIEAISNIKKILAEETLPPPTRNPRKCEPCEYRKYCKRI